MSLPRDCQHASALRGFPLIGLPIAVTVLTVALRGVGDVSTGQFQGGPHNALRRHEDWSEKTEHFRGSLVCLFRSRDATGNFGLNGDFYKPSSRDWTHETTFNSIHGLPPFTPQSVTVEPLVTW